MRCLFWNAGRNDVDQLLGMLAKSLQLDILALAEYTGEPEALIARLRDQNLIYYYLPTIGCKKIHLFSKLDPSHSEIVGQETSDYTFRLFKHPQLGPIIFSFVHFPSKLHTSESGRFTLAMDLKQAVDELEVQLQIDQSLIVGDFNMDPFENAMVYPSALHALSTRTEAKKLTKTVRRVSYSTFFNPMWNLFGDRSRPPGTYYYANSEANPNGWNMFDQVIYRPQLIPHIDLDRIRIMTHADAAGLNLIVNGRGFPMSSDHLPLYFEIMEGSEYEG